MVMTVALVFVLTRDLHAVRDGALVVGAVAADVVLLLFASLGGAGVSGGDGAAAAAVAANAFAAAAPAPLLPRSIVRLPPDAVTVSGSDVHVRVLLDLPFLSFPLLSSLKTLPFDLLILHAKE